MDVEQLEGWAEERAVALSKGRDYRTSVVTFPGEG